MEIKNNKKGMFFTIITIALLSLFLLSYTFYSFYGERKSVDKRIETMNNFIFSLESDMSRQVYISGYRAILSIENYITTQGDFVDNSESALEELLLNGSINGEEMGLMEDFKLGDWSSRVSEMGEKVNVAVNYTLKSVEVYQKDPWFVDINMTIDLFIVDKNNVASWNRTQNIISKIEITEFEDPLYLINSNGRVTNKINQTIYTFFVSGSDVSNLLDHNEKGYYIPSSNAPSFLDRLEGKTSANENGIESLVYLPSLSEQGVSIKEKSIVDYIYFSDSDPSSHRIQGTPYWFRIDEEHLDDYGVEGLTI